MTRRHIRSGSPFEDKVGYSRAVRVGDMVFVAGTVGRDPETNLLPEGVADQCRNALAIIAAALAEAGSGFGDVVRVVYYLPDRHDFEACWPHLREAFGAAPPAATMVQAGLIDPAMKIEIEVTAIVTV